MMPLGPVFKQRPISLYSLLDFEQDQMAGFEILSHVINYYEKKCPGQANGLKSGRCGWLHTQPGDSLC